MAEQANKGGSLAAWAAGGEVLGGLFAGKQQAEAQAAANKANAALMAQQLGEQMYQFDVQTGELSRSRREREDIINRILQERFKGQSAGLDPFAQAGRQASAQRAAFLGLSGPEAQQQAYGAFAESPGQAFLRQRMERALLRNTAALGGLGGGNVRRALQEQAFGLAQTDLDRHLAQLGFVSSQGQQAATSQIGGPGYVQTGTDIGVREGPIRPPPTPIETPEAPGGIFGLGIGGIL